MKRSYLPQDLAKECGRKIPERALVPLFEIMWQMIEEALRNDQFAGVSSPVFCADCGHYKRGEWECAVDGMSVIMRPIYTDMNTITTDEAAIYLVWRIEIEADEEIVVSGALSRINYFVKRSLGDKAQIQMLYKRAAELLKKYRADVFSSDVRRAFNLGGA